MSRKKVRNRIKKEKENYKNLAKVARKIDDILYPRHFLPFKVSRFTTKSEFRMSFSREFSDIKLIRSELLLELPHPREVGTLA